MSGTTSLRDAQDDREVERIMSLTEEELVAELGDHVVVKAEIDGEWIEVIREWHDGSFSHIVEPLGMRRRQADAKVGQTNYAVKQ